MKEICFSLKGGCYTDYHLTSVGKTMHMVCIQYTLSEFQPFSSISGGAVRLALAGYEPDSTQTCMYVI